MPAGLRLWIDPHLQLQGCNIDVHITRKSKYDFFFFFLLLVEFNFLYHELDLKETSKVPTFTQICIKATFSMNDALFAVEKS